jgi:sigma-B regulation protein RsbU (phosphoserine phosphatase)
MEPAHGVLAGDWYDVIRIDEDRAALVLVDVSGHGEEAGLRALWLKHLLVPAVRMGLDPGDALNWVAKEVGDTGEWFATCVIIEIDTSTGVCRYANAGHLPPLLLCATGVFELPVTGPLFGPLPGHRWHTGETSLGEGEVLVAYTDGIIEARNPEGEEFGDERLIACLRSARRRDTHTLTEDVMNTVHRFGSERLKDDATLAVVGYAKPGRSPKAARDEGDLRVP